MLPPTVAAIARPHSISSRYPRSAPGCACQRHAHQIQWGRALTLARIAKPIAAPSGVLSGQSGADGWRVTTSENDRHERTSLQDHRLDQTPKHLLGNRVRGFLVRKLPDPNEKLTGEDGQHSLAGFPAGLVAVQKKR